MYIVIPARYASSRLPGKPLLDIAGKPMLQHVYECARCSQAQEVVIATDDERIARVAKGFGATVCMTASHHTSGTERIAEVIAQFGWPEETIVVNLQGDEPLMPVELLDQVANDLNEHPQADTATLATPLEQVEQLFDTNIVKVVLDKAGYALYFSRAPIPWQRDNWPGEVKDCTQIDAAALTGCLRHIGLYAYRAGFIRRYVQWPSAPIERFEALEQLRTLWHGGRIHVSLARAMPPAGVDTVHDLQRVRCCFSKA